MSFGVKMHSKTFLKIKYRHLAVFEWTIEYSLSILSERVCTGIFLGGGAHFCCVCHRGRTTPKQPILLWQSQ